VRGWITALHDNPDMGLLVTVLGTHAGVGTTTLAVNLAAALAQDGPDPVRLVELDETLGHLAVDLGVEPVGAVTDAATLAAGPRGRQGVVDLTALMTPLAPGLTALLAPPAVPAHPGHPRIRLGAGETARLLEAVRRDAAVVADAPAAFDDPVVAALAMSDRVVVVTSPEGPAVEALRLTLESLALMEVPTDRVCLVLNHLHAGAPLDEVLPVTATIPECPDLEDGTVLVAPRDVSHPLSVAVRQLVRAVRTAPASAGEPGTGNASGDGPVGRLLRRRSH
jgi:MinD-like ATPase involved in chromosome partitioning or flagellar assembly